MNIDLHDSGHMNKMATMPTYGEKTLTNLLSANQWADFDESWYEASVTRAHYILFKRYLLVALDIFYAKVKLCNLGVYLGKCDNYRNYCILWTGIRLI